MSLEKLLGAARQAADPRAWTTGVELQRAGAVAGVSNDGDEVHCKVKARGRALPHDVYVWPSEPDWGCDCGLPGDCCPHVVAAVIALRQGDLVGETVPEPKKEFKVALAYDFVTSGAGLDVRRSLVWPDGRRKLLTTAIADADVIVDENHVRAEAAIAAHSGGPIGATELRRLLAQLVGAANVTLNGKPVRVARDPVTFRVRVTDQGEGFKLALVRPPGIDQMFRGAAVVGDSLHSTSHGSLDTDQRRALVEGVVFSADEVGGLVSETIPRLRDRIPIEVATTRLPSPEQCAPRLVLRLAERSEGLRVEAVVAYGDPPIAVVENGMLRRLGDTMPARDPSSERALARHSEDVLGVAVGVPRVLAPDKAAAFLRDKLPLHHGTVEGKVDRGRFRIHDEVLTPHLDVAAADGGYKLAVSFRSDDGDADVIEVLRAFTTGRTLVPLLEGGWARLPEDWLAVHGPVLRELLEARDAAGVVRRASAAPLLELLEDTDAVVPPDLARLRDWLDGGEGLPEAPPTPGLMAELRPYQITGARWMRFLREVSLHGVLADDMGLGKTLQTIAALLATKGPHLVVAPTSVLGTWQREVERFAPKMNVHLYHGPTRALKKADLTLTSYAVLRLDKDLLAEREWSYVALDEAQAIKNPDSQTARAACSLKAKYRLCLSGTPVENRLEELWSLFRFLMPGYLGSREVFRDRFSKPIEAGDKKAGEALRRRVRPYVLRRLKKQVARELPELTEVVVRCELPDGQRRIYEAVRIAALAEVQEALDTGQRQRRTFEILEALLRMRQAACDPALLPGDHGDVAAGKLDRLEELLVDIVPNGHKVLVFSQWTSLLDRVEPRLAQLGLAWARLDGSTKDRQSVVDKFQDPSGPPIFLLSLKAGGTGLNLTAADYVVILDPWWNPAVEQQAMDRAHRIGQDKPVVALRLVAEDTVEDRILALQDAKRGLADAALGGDGGFLHALSSDELRSLFATE
jgi:hypothetical protein